MLKAGGVCAGLLGTHNSITTNEIIESDVLSAMLTLISSIKHKSQLAGLRVIGALALTSDAAAGKLLTSRLEQLLMVRLRQHGLPKMFALTSNSRHL